MSSSSSSTSSSTMDFEFEFRVRVSAFKIPGSSFEYPFGGPFSVTLRVHLGIHSRSLSGSQKEPEKEHSEQRTNYQHSKRISSRKCRVGSIRSHSPISLTLPLSSFGWLRNNSSSHRCSASFRNYFSGGVTKRTPQFLDGVALSTSSRPHFLPALDQLFYP